VDRGKKAINYIGFGEAPSRLWDERVRAKKEILDISRQNTSQASGRFRSQGQSGRGFLAAVRQVTRKKPSASSRTTDDRMETQRKGKSRGTRYRGRKRKIPWNSEGE